MKNIDYEKLREDLIKEEKSGGKKTDTRYLNYFDLEFNDEITVRLLPDGGDSGKAWLDFAMHGPNLKNYNIDNISCIHLSKSEKCPICNYSYQFYTQGDKQQAEKWRRKEYSKAQCVVIDSPITINESEDGNSVKLVNFIWGMKEVVKNAIINGTVDDITKYDFVIKKTKNQGGFAAYDKSYFKTQKSALPKSLVESIKSEKSYLYDLSTLMPDDVSFRDSQVWLDNTITAMEVGSHVSTANSVDVADQSVQPVSSDATDTESVDTDDKHENDDATDADQVLALLSKRK